jgi:AcrR family transcriptional regulator
MGSVDSTPTWADRATPSALSDPASTRERLRAAALELFGEKGYDGASMTALADRVGIAKPSLYNYYRSKDELLLDLVEEGMRQWMAACMPPFSEPGSFERQLARHLRLTVDFAQSRPHVVSVFQLATAHVQGELAARVQTRVEVLETEVRQLVDRSLRQAIDRGELSGVNAEEVHVFLGIFFHGLLFLQTSCPHLVGPTNTRLESVWRILFRGLSGRDPEETLA